MTVKSLEFVEITSVPKSGEEYVYFVGAGFNLNSY